MSINCKEATGFRRRPFFGLLVALLPCMAGALEPQILFNFTNAPHAPSSRFAIGPDGTLYGTTQGGLPGSGTVFKITTNDNWTAMVNFLLPSNIGGPHDGLAWGPDGNLYGVTADGGFPSGGTLFRVTPAGQMTTLVILTNGNSWPATNVTGARPYGGLTPGQDGNFYGTTAYGGLYSYGNVFRLTTNGVLTSLTNFTTARPRGTLFLASDGSLYGGASKDDNSGFVFRVTTNGALKTLAPLGGARVTAEIGGYFYGAAAGGIGNNGIIFRMMADGTWTKLVDFVGTNGRFPTGVIMGTNGDFYGTTSEGGEFNGGTLFRLSTNGVLTTLVHFNGQNGYLPEGVLTPGNNGVLYGATYAGAAGVGYPFYGNGTVFQYSESGGFKTLVSLATTHGANPSSLYAGDDGQIYGATFIGGTNGRGTVFRLDGGELTTLAHFNGTNGDRPRGHMVLKDGDLYGTTVFGGDKGDVGEVGGGVVFRVGTNGMTTFATFSNSVGTYPWGGVTLGTDGQLYGTTYSGGAENKGTAFRVATNGAIDALVTFYGTNGDSSWTGLKLGADNQFYGATSRGGQDNNGTLFKMTANGNFTPFASFSYTNQGPIGVALGNGRIYGITRSDYGTMLFQISSNAPLKNLLILNGNMETMGSPAVGPDGNLYGITLNHGDWGKSWVFKLSPGGELTTLAEFDYTETADYTGSSDPGEVIFGSEGSLYGRIWRGGLGGAGVIFRLDLPPTFVSGPASRVNGIGTTATFAVGVTGTAPFGYRWFKAGSELVDGGNVSGVASNVLTLANVSPADAANYYVVVTNISGSVTSSVAALTVLTGTSSAVTSVQPPSGSQPNTATLNFAGVPGVEYLVQFATNLTDSPWFTLSTNTADAQGVWMVTDASSTNAQRFYRVVAR